MSGVVGLVKIPELRKRILFTLGVIAVYRLGVHVPAPGVDPQALQQAFANMKGTIFGWFNLFSGGAFERFSIFALGLMPYISSSIIFQLLTVAWPYLGELQKEGEQGRKKITQYTRYGTVLLCMFQGFTVASQLEGYANPQVVLNPGLAFKAMTMLTLAGGTIFLMWLGEQISERGIGNGSSVLIFAGIATDMPGAFGSALSLLKSGEISLVKLAIVGILIVATFFGIIFMERGQRRIPIQYAKRIIGQKVYGGQNTHLPLKVNTSGVIPPIFAQSLIMFPATLTMFFPYEPIQKFSRFLVPGEVLFNIIFVGLIVFFAYFYTSVAFKTEDIAENLKKYGGFVPGIRPGPPTTEYIDYVLSRITASGACYIAAICLLPSLISQKIGVPFAFGGTSILILVGVALDTAAQIETYLLSSNYEGFMKHARVKGRNG